MWIIVGIAGLLATVAVGTLNLTLMIYPFYIFLANSAVVMGYGASRTAFRIALVHSP